MRQLLDMPAGKSTIRLCNLIPGNTYTVHAVKTDIQEPANFYLLPAPDLAQAVPGTQKDRKQELRFTATAECAEFVVEAETIQQTTALPMVLSITCTDCPAGNPKDKGTESGQSPNLSVIPGVPATTLVKNKLIGGNCFEVTNITSAGPDSAFGIFTNGGTSIGIDSGIVICTGNVSILPGPNVDFSSSGNVNGLFGDKTRFDADLAKLTQGDQRDVMTLEFDFTPTANQVKFDYVFGSEEYCEWVDLNFNDVFGFFISGPGITGTQNLAVLPNTSTPISIHTVNHNVNSQYYVNNSQTIFDLDCLFKGAFNLNDCELDGWTKTFTATANVIPCETYHIKLAIADITDELVASAVFLRANSFNAGGTAKAEVVYAGDLPVAYEDCQTSFIRFSRDSSDINLPLEVSFAVSGTATPGVDYTALISPITIPAGQNEVLYPVFVFNDAVPEGQESIIVTLDNPCTCGQSEVEFLIEDKPPLSVGILPLATCGGAPVELNPTVISGVAPYTYLWSTGETTPSITVSAPGEYILTIEDFCNRIGVIPIDVDSLPNPELTDTISFCPGDSIVINGVSYTASGTVLDTLPGMNGACDTLVTYILKVLPQPALSDTIFFCLGDSIEIGGTVYNSSGTVIDTLPGLNGGCDTIITYELIVLEPPTRSETLAFCPGASVTIGGTVYTTSGTVMDTIPGLGGGCDTIVTYTLVLLPQPTRSETIALCPRTTANINGVDYPAPGTVLDTIPGTNGGCDTIVTYTLVLLPQPTRAETVSLCPGATITIDGVAYPAPGTVTDTIPGAAGACDTIVTYSLVLLPQPVRAETIAFCPGELIHIGGNTYTQPGTVVDTIPAVAGCDTIVTYTLKFLTPAPSTVSLTCPSNIVLETGGPSPVSYNTPLASSDCPCPGISVKLLSGLTSGSTFPIGASNICYQATDSCGHTNSCCFSVTLTETKACDTKLIGCIKYELLSITQDAAHNTTYRIRVTNTCNPELLYTAFELPDGIVAKKPANNAIYTAPGGHDYEVRNPNFSPFYSIRYSPVGTGISGGAADIFEFTLPPRSFPDYIHVIAKVATQSYYEAYLNTFYCPVGKTPTSERNEELAGNATGLRVFPNPTTGTLFADLSAWQGKPLGLRVFDVRGSQIVKLNVVAGPEAQEIRLPEALAGGLYFLEVLPQTGESQVLRFVVQH